MMEVKTMGGYTEVTTERTYYSFYGTDPAELMAKAAQEREHALHLLSTAEVKHTAAMALVIDNQRRAIEAATQKRERAAATRQRNKEARW